MGWVRRIEMGFVSAVEACCLLLVSFTLFLGMCIKKRYPNAATRDFMVAAHF